ncbi:MAG: hypothetical protein ACJAS9_003923 [Polaribacter sp.]|jgi:hypothetical protein
MAEIELKIKKQNENAEFNAKEAEAKQQASLQRSYRALEIKEKVKDMPLEGLVNFVNTKIINKKY